MRVLCIDTSSNLCSVAVLEDSTLINKFELDNGLTHSETLMPLIKKVLDNSSLSLKDIDLLVADIGPGSFTGIRIGVATVKAFSDSLNIPCVGINSLEVLAHNIKDNGLICSTIDCKNDNCYFALYELIDGTYTVLEEPCAKTVSEVLDLLNKKYNKSINFVGDGIPSKSTSFHLNIENLGLAGLKKFISNNISEEILPLYLKKPQAQKQLEEKLQINKMTLSDLDDIKNILASDFDNFWNYDVLKQELECENSYFIITKNNTDEIVGFAGLKVICDEADIMNIVVKKSFRHNGIGSILLDNLISYAKSLNLKTVTLEVNEHNLSAIRLYDKFNFDHLGIRKKYYDGKSDAIIMSKKI